MPPTNPARPNEEADPVYEPEGGWTHTTTSGHWPCPACREDCYQGNLIYEEGFHAQCAKCGQRVIFDGD